MQYKIVNFFTKIYKNFILFIVMQNLHKKAVTFHVTASSSSPNTYYRQSIVYVTVLFVQRTERIA